MTINFQYANNVVAVKWFDNRAVTMFGTCIEECNKVSTVACRVKGQSAKIPAPCPEIIKDYNSGMGGVDLLDQKTSAFKLDPKSSGGRYYLRIFFDLMDICVANSHAIYKVLYPKGMELLDFKIVLVKSLIGTYNSRSRNTPVSHLSCREVFQASVPLHLPVLQKTREKFRYCCNGGIDNKIYIQFNTFVVFFVLDFRQWISKMFPNLHTEV